MKTIIIPEAKNYQINEEGKVTNVKFNTPVFAQKDGAINVISNEGKTFQIKDPKKFAAKLFDKKPKEVKEHKEIPAKSVPGAEDYIMGADGTIITMKGGKLQTPKNNKLKLIGTEGGDYTITDVRKMHKELFPDNEYTAEEKVDKSDAGAKENKPTSKKEKATQTTPVSRGGNKIKEIREMFAAGKTNAEIIEAGYNKGTINVQRGKWNKENNISKK